MDIRGKKIILTGASSGIGEEVLKKLIEYDVDIIAVARNIDKIPKLSKRVIPFACDVSKRENIDKLFDFAIQTLGGIDIFIANAGFAYCEDLQEADWEHIENIYNTNVFSPIYSLEKMKQLNIDKEYYTVVTCSAVSKVPLPGYSLYCSTKSAIDMFARVYRYEATDKGRLALVYPIATSTNFFNNAGDNAPVPWPVQSSHKVAKSIIRGIERDKKSIYPSWTFLATERLNRVFPFIYYFYAKVHALKFKKWIEARN